MFIGLLEDVGDDPTMNKDRLSAPEVINDFILANIRQIKDAYVPSYLMAGRFKALRIDTTIVGS